MKVVLHDYLRTNDIYKRREMFLQNLHLIRSELNGLKLREITSSKYHTLRDIESKQVKLLSANNKEIMITEQLKIF